MYILDIHFVCKKITAHIDKTVVSVCCFTAREVIVMQAS